ncbi:hypothetical protein ACWT_0985 [Actinoplanes sp. SE50]|uniref:hypothetical protein n=1 Tax=unclassified Actinoplanes TaxID=2626549 RepID=UPI00023EC8D6|nr:MULTISPECIES: hypothetical protein [unclassified Actinoplanes]AEV82001.1 hypothetical protein ACPL_1104 [Actinoplanes sp. SE50/110]ATO80400.1 hypothetical protein ACWT_0985 [Actinoplanes sp. SE50]SLL97807.1 hypothetical protein ACSP50_1017 [Actinoplanes sp. SE50/110]
MQPNVEIDVEGLVRTGTQVQDSSGSVRDAITKESGWLTVAGAAAPWAAVATMADRAHGWATYLQDLAERIRLSGAGMVGAAIDYQTTDHDSGTDIAGTYPAPGPHHGPHMGYAE